MTLTEATVLQLLRERHTAVGNGGAGEHAFLAHVRNAAGFDANRTFDAVAVNLWPSRGLSIHVYEVKVSRSDWKRELAKPAKAEDACRNRRPLLHRRPRRVREGRRTTADVGA